MRRPALGVVATLVVAWGSFLALAPLVAARISGAIPLRISSGGILFDLSPVTLAGYRTLILAPIVAALTAGVVALLIRPTPSTIALGILGFLFAGTELVIGGGLGIGPASKLLIGTEWRWVWRICAVALGL